MAHDTHTRLDGSCHRGARVARVSFWRAAIGVNQTKAALFIYNGYIPLRTAVGNFIAAAPAIGVRSSLGPEDPSLQILQKLRPTTIL